jgi:succinyl-CoA synthetase beta subunit/citryl-CoA synthetase large subunit
MKAGLIKFPDDRGTVAQDAKRLIRDDCRTVLVEQRLATDAEAFLGVLYDPARRAPVLIYTPHGGVDVESESAGSIVRLDLDPRVGLQEFLIRSALSRAHVTGQALRTVTSIAVAVARLFFELDATLIEINPLAHVAGEGWVALDAHVELDGDALVRHPDLVTRFSLSERGDGGRTPTTTELAAREIDGIDHRGVAGKLVEFDGDIALIVGGGGASLTVLDAILDAGGHPANYCEVGGNPTVEKVSRFTRLLLESLRPQHIAVIMNVVSNTRADLVARGVIKGCLDAGRRPSEAVAVFRAPGAWEAESHELLEHYGISALGRDVSIDAAARLAVQAAAQ